MGGFEMRTGETISPNKRRAKLSNIQLLCKMQMSNQISQGYLEVCRLQL